MFSLLTALVLAAPASTAAPQVGCEVDASVGPGMTTVDVVVFDGDEAPLAGALVFGGNGLTPQLESSTDATGHSALSLGAAEDAATVLVYHDAGDARVEVPLSGGTRCLVSLTIGEPTPDVMEMNDGRVMLVSTDGERELGQRLQGLGIGMLALGGALGIGAAFAAIISPCTDGSIGGSCSSRARNGLIMGFAIPGALTVSGGVAMIIVGARKMKGRAAVTRLDRPVFVPTMNVGRGGFAAGVVGRF